MFRSLRKGRTTVYFQHSTTGSTIGAEKYESDVSDGKATIRFCLRPLDGNQKEDEELLHTDKICSISIDDLHIINRFMKHVNSSIQDITCWEIQVVSCGKTLSFAVKPELENESKNAVLYFHVLGTNG